MRPRRGVDLLPTISEMQEGDWEEGDPDLPTHSMEEYLDSIKELAQPASYPLRAHRRWPTRHATAAARCPIITPLPIRQSSMAYAPWASVNHLALPRRRPDRGAPACSDRDPLDWLFAQSQFAGLP